MESEKREKTGLHEQKPAGWSRKVTGFERRKKQGVTENELHMYWGAWLLEQRTDGWLEMGCSSEGREQKAGDQEINLTQRHNQTGTIIKLQ